MLYLKNALSGFGRNLHDSALHAFHGPHRWWKLALFAALFVLPGGSVIVALVAWLDHRRDEPHRADAAAAAQAGDAAAAPLAVRAASRANPRRGSLPDAAPRTAKALCSAAQRSLQATLREPCAKAVGTQAPLRP
jgi:hypothetical protein